MVDEHTNVGPVMDALVTRVKRNQEPLGVDPHYDLLREHFDHLNFLLRNPALSGLQHVDPIRFFLRNGPDAVNSPDYNFDMRNYLERYPERRLGPEPSPYLAWLARGRAAGEIADPGQGIEDMARVLGLEPQQVAEELVATRTDMMERLRTGKLGEMFAKAVEIEPLIGAAWAETPRTRMVPLGGKYLVGQLAAIHDCQAVTGFRRARIVVVTNRPQGARGQRLEDHLACSLAGTLAPEDLVVIYTDDLAATSDEPALAPHDRLPAGVHQVDFAAIASGLPEEHQQQALVSLLRSLRAEAIVNVDSALFYRALTPYGMALAASERIFLYFRCHEQNAHGIWDGWALKWFYAGFDLVAGVLTDSECLRDQLIDAYQLGDEDRERVHHLPSPVDPELAVAAVARSEPGRLPVVHWAGRWDRQRSVDLALQVARRMPDVDFRFWVEMLVENDPTVELPPNVRLEVVGGRVSELPLAGADAWLYTSAWDGVPGILLEVAMAEVPIVASLVGGVGELLSDEDSWPIADWEEPVAYEKALREVLADPAQARRRSHAMRERLERDRSRRAYGELAARVLLAGSHEEEAR